MEKFLQVEKVAYSYSTALALKEISFSLDKGKFLGIIGPNGAGKTTLLKAINRTFAIQRGKIFLQGTDLATIPLRKIAQTMSMLGQDIEVNFTLTVLDLVLMGRFPHLARFKRESKADLNIAYECMELTETAALANRAFNQLSAGERQRVILAKALAQNPQLLLLDEPTAHLDIGHQIRIFDLLAKLNQEKGLTIIAVLHDLNLASEYCQKLLFLDQGQLISYGDPENVLQYASIEKAYGTVVLVKDNPLTGRPYVLPVSARVARFKKT